MIVLYNLTMSLFNDKWSFAYKMTELHRRKVAVSTNYKPVHQHIYASINREEFTLQMPIQPYTRPKLLSHFACKGPGARLNIKMPSY